MKGKYIGLTTFLFLAMFLLILGHAAATSDTEPNEVLTPTSNTTNLCTTSDNELVGASTYWNAVNSYNNATYLVNVTGGDPSTSMFDIEDTSTSYFISNLTFKAIVEGEVNLDVFAQYGFVIITHGQTYSFSEAFGDEETSTGCTAKATPLSSSSWYTVEVTLTLNPYTNDYWTKDEVDNLKLGILLKGGSDGHYSRCSYLAATVNYGNYKIHPNDIGVTGEVLSDSGCGDNYECVDEKIWTGFDDYTYNLVDGTVKTEVYKLDDINFPAGTTINSITGVWQIYGDWAWTESTAFQPVLYDENEADYTYGTAANYFEHNNITTIYSKWIVDDTSDWNETHVNALSIGGKLQAIEYGSNTSHYKLLRCYAEVNYTLSLNIHDVSPNNGSTNNQLQPRTCINVSHISGDLQNITWYWKDGASWSQYGFNDTSATGNGTYCQSFLNATDCCEEYEWKVEIQNGTETYTSSYYFDTLCLDPPSNVSATLNTSTSIDLAWSNFTINVSGNFSTVVVYSNSSYPSNPGDGTIAYNGTGESYTLTGLNQLTTYYFSFFTYYNITSDASCLSSSSKATRETAGGDYNITIKWECNQTLIDAGDTGFLNSRIEFTKKSGLVIERKNNFTTNPFDVSIDTNPDIIYFFYNNGSAVRKVIPDSDQSNITFFVCCYNTTTITDVYNNNASDYQFPYVLNVNDKTVNSLFVKDTYTYMTIYKFNDTGRYNVTQDYLSASNDVTAYLHYGERYFIGIENDKYDVDLVQYVDLDYRAEYEIYIENLTSTKYPLNNLINVSLEWTTDSLWINVSDTTYKTEQITISIYELSENGTETFIREVSFALSEKNYEFTQALGANTSKRYKVYIEIEYPNYDTNIFGFIKDTYEDITKVISDPDWINNLFENTLGTCPMSPLQWTDMISFIIAMMFLLSFGALYAEAGLLTSGGILIFLQAIFGIVTASMSGIVISLGIVLIILGVIFVYGGKR